MSRKKIKCEASDIIEYVQLPRNEFDDERFLERISDSNLNESTNNLDDVKNCELLKENIAEWAKIYKVKNNAVSALLKMLTPLSPIQGQGSEGSEFDQILQLLQIVKRDNAELRHDIKGLRNEFKVFREKSESTQKRLLTEILFLNKKQNVIYPVKLLPKNPFSEQIDLINFENSLNDSPETALLLEEEMFKISINNSSKFIRNVYKLIFTDKLAKQYSWRGTAEKQSVRTLTVTSALRSAFNRRFQDGEKIFEAVSIKWFQTANDRVKLQKKK